VSWDEPPATLVDARATEASDLRAARHDDSAATDTHARSFRKKHDFTSTSEPAGERWHAASQRPAAIRRAPTSRQKFTIACGSRSRGWTQMESTASTSSAGTTGPAGPITFGRAVMTVVA